MLTPTSPMQPADTRYLYKRNGLTYGPVNLPELLTLCRREIILPDTLVSRYGSATFSRLCTTDLRTELFPDHDMARNQAAPKPPLPTATGFSFCSPRFVATKRQASPQKQQLRA